MTGGVDTARLRALAEAATPGPWFQSGPPWDGSGALVQSQEDPHQGFVIADCAVIDDGDRDPLDALPQWDAAFIAAAHPGVVLALVEAAAMLRETRAYVYNVATEHRGNWRGETAAEILARVDAALAPFAAGDTAT